MRDIIIFGSQKASINSFFFGLKNDPNLKNHITLLNIGKIKNINHKTFLNKIIITGTSNDNFEKNLWTFFIKNKIKFFAYVDSYVNLNQRFANSNYLPNNLLVPNIKVKKILKDKFKDKIKKMKITIIGNPFHNYLYKNKKKFVEKKNHLMFLTSFKGIKKEFPIINKIITNKLDQNIKLYLCLHPRENFSSWEKKFKNHKQVKVVQNNFLNKIKFVKFVYGIDTMGLIDAYYLSKEVYYMKASSGKNSIMQNMFDTLGMGYFKIRRNNLVHIKKRKIISRPNFVNISEILNE